MPNEPLSNLESDLRRVIPALRRYTMYLCRKGAIMEADDLEQLVLLKAISSYNERPDPDGNIKGWVTRIAHNEFTSSVRQTGRRNDLLDGISGFIAWGGGGKESDSLGSTSALEMREIANRLPPRSQALLARITVDGQSYAEVATEMNTTVPAIRDALYRAKKALRAEFEAAA